jgi:5-formyltetrahydrofolate cyclo-ligase
MPSVKEEKRALRAHYKEKRRLISSDAKAVLDAALCRAITQLDAFRRADVILAFYPSFLEPDIIPVINEALKRKKKVAFPMCNVSDHTMRFKYVSDLNELKLGSYSIPEPQDSNEEYSGEAFALSIVPALAFDKNGYRLGYGAGYYDRFLSDFNGISVGAAYSEFITDTLPHDIFDIKTDIIISERGTIFINAGKNKITDK